MRVGPVGCLDPREQTPDHRRGISSKEQLLKKEFTASAALKVLEQRLLITVQEIRNG